MKIVAVKVESLLLLVVGVLLLLVSAPDCTEVLGRYLPRCRYHSAVR